MIMIMLSEAKLMMIMLDNNNFDNDNLYYDHCCVHCVQVVAVNKVGLSPPSPPSYHMMTLREIPKGGHQY